MVANEFLRHLNEGPISPVYLFTGEADLLTEEAWNRLADIVVPSKGRRYNAERLPAGEHSAAEVAERLRTLPMFSKMRLIMVQNAEAWPEEDRKVLLSYLAKPCPTSCLVLWFHQKKGLKKIEDAVAAVGKTVNFQTPPEWELPRWLRERAGRFGKSITPQAASFLVAQAGADLQLLDLELGKAALYVGERGAIELEDIRQSASSQRSFTVFEMLRYVIQRKASQAVIAAGNLIESGEHPLGILALLTWQVRLLWQVKDGLARGLSESEIAGALKQKPFVVKNMAKEAPRITVLELHRAHAAIREADIAIKSSTASPSVILESLIYRLCQGKKSP
jgi:DNA polymerase III subunit delta